MITTVNHSHSNWIYKEDIDFTQMFKSLNDTRELLQVLADACESEDFDTVLDMSYEINIDLDIFELYCARFISTNDILNHSLQIMRPKVETFKEELAKAFGLNTKTLPNFTDLTKYTCGVYATLMYFDFNLNGLLEDQPFVESCVIPTITDIDIPQFMEDILKEIGWCKKSFSLFEFYPDLEKDFYSIMGPEAALIDEQALTLEQVQDVVNGVITAEDLLAIHLDIIKAEKEQLAAEEFGVNHSGVFN